MLKFTPMYVQQVQQANCTHTFVAYRGKGTAVPNWCPTCGRVKTKEDGQVIHQTATQASVVAQVSKFSTGSN